jgi:hypothetical protein
LGTQSANAGEANTRGTNSRGTDSRGKSHAGLNAEIVRGLAKHAKANPIRTTDPMDLRICTRFPALDRATGAPVDSRRLDGSTVELQDQWQIAVFAQELPV